MSKFRIGYSRDIHLLVANRPLLLGGVLIDYHLGFKAHSDGDIVLHALTESILGALALGDLGSHFPDTDSTYLNKDSTYFLNYALNKLEQHQYIIANLDISIALEKPKLQPYIEKIRQSLADKTKLQLHQISIKAMTNEGVDAIGKGLAAEAICLLLIEKIEK